MEALNRWGFNRKHNLQIAVHCTDFIKEFTHLIRILHSYGVAELKQRAEINAFDNGELALGAIFIKGFIKRANVIKRFRHGDFKGVSFRFLARIICKMQDENNRKDYEVATAA
jgi:hypothetical protein